MSHRGDAGPVTAGATRAGRTRAATPPVRLFLCTLVASFALVPVLGAPAPASSANVASPSPLPLSNLLVGDAAGFSASTGGWLASGGSLTWSGSGGDATPGELILAASSSSGASAESSTTATPAVGAQTYVATASVSGPDERPGGLRRGELLHISGILLERRLRTGGDPVGRVAGADRGVGIAPPKVPRIVSVGVVLEAGTTTAGQGVDIDNAPAPDVARQREPRSSGRFPRRATRSSRAMGNRSSFGAWHSTASRSTRHCRNLSQEDIAEIHQWGANTVRIPMNESFWLSNSCSYARATRRRSARS